MKEFDRYIRQRIAKEDGGVSEPVHRRIESTLASLPTMIRSRRTNLGFIRTASALCASLFFVFMLILPNVSAVYAENASDIPVIGKIISVFTLRSYADSGEKYCVDVSVPAVMENGSAFGTINDDIESLTESITKRFYSDLGEHYGSLNIGYETVTDTDDWFTLKLSVSETSAGGYNCAKYYHIDRKTGAPVTFGDLFGTDGMAQIGEMILGKMKDEMARDSEMVYWVDEITVDREMLITADPSSDPGILMGIPDANSSSKSQSAAESVFISAEKIPCVSPDQNFYFTDDGNMVIVYDEYTVAPGSMGCPEIVIEKEEYTPYLAEKQ